MKKLKVLIGCEYSAIVREAFKKVGADAWSCDLLPTEVPGNHYCGNVLDILGQGWDLAIFHPPCTYLCVSGARWFEGRRELQSLGLAFVKQLMLAPIPRICIENPVSIISSRIRKPDQVLQPWQFGHGECKSICLRLKNLPLLQPTCFETGREQKIHNMSPGPERSKERSRFYTGIAEAMAKQWSGLPKLEYVKPLF